MRLASLHVPFAFQGLRCENNVMATHATKWPDGMNDEEAVERLQSILILACEGNKDLSHGRDYKALRGPLVGRPDLADVVPKFVRSQRDLNSFWSYIKRFDPKWESRREHVWSSFRPLFDRVEGRTQPPTAASAWTGRRSPQQQARIVLAMVPDARLAIEMLLEEQQRGLHNGGEVEPERLQGIQRLKELHAALGELLRLAETGQSLTGQLMLVKDIKDKTLAMSKETLSLTLAGIPQMASSSVFGLAAYTFINIISKGVSDTTSIGASAAVMAAHTAGSLAKKKQTSG
jgi:hypothetical protein